MEQINLTKLINGSRLDDDSKESWLKWALIHLISRDGPKSSDQFFPDRDPEKKTEAVCNVEMKINGVDVQFSSLLERLVDQFNRNVDLTARNYVSTKVDEAINKLQDTVNDFQDRISQAGTEFQTQLIRNEAQPDIDETTKNEVIWAALLSMTQDVHAAQDTMTERQWNAAERLYKEYERRVEEDRRKREG